MGFWDTLAAMTGDSSIGDTPDQIAAAIDEAKKAEAEETEAQWVSNNSSDSGKDSKSGYGDTGGGPNVADSNDYGANSGISYNG